MFATHRESPDIVEFLNLNVHRWRPDTTLGNPQEIEQVMDLKSGTKWVVQN